VRAADWLIDLGPEGGAGGGQLVGCGTPEQLADIDASHTGAALRATGLGTKRRSKKSAAKPRKKSTRRPPPTNISVKGARTHNLQSIDCEIPIGKFTVVTGPSGSGKSSLAFDTVFQEGQRRFLESMSTYARRFLGRMDQAPVDSLDGLGPAIAIDQKRTSRSPRSTVATTTEIHDYMRLLYARIGRHHCPTHEQELHAWSPSKASGHCVKQFPGARAFVLAPVVIPSSLKGKPRTEWMTALREDWQRNGYVRALVNGEEQRIDEPWTKKPIKELFLIIDRTVIKDRTRLTDALEQAQTKGKDHSGQTAAMVQLVGGKQDGERHWFAAEPSCERCDYRAPQEPHPRWFSFNHHSGACAHCLGLGDVVICPEDLLVNHPNKPTFGGAIQHRGGAFTFLTATDGYYHEVAQAVARRFGFDLKLPWKKLPDSAKTILLRGAGDERFDVVFKKNDSGKKREWRMSVPWKGMSRQVEDWFHGRDQEQSGDDRFGGVMRGETCEHCSGDRLQAGPRSVRVGGVRLPEVLRQTVDEATTTLAGLKLDKTDKRIAADVLKELRHRLSFLRETGLGYLTLERSAATLSGGEAQRIRLATQLGNKLVGVLYVLDEPTVGLHPRDTERLLNTLLELRDLGNTVLAVEHDEVMVRSADHVLDIGPGAGVRGGHICASGTPAIVAASDTLTGRWLNNTLGIEVRDEKNRRDPVGRIEMRDVAVHNLQHVNVDVPLGILTAITGVSGSGKSSLIMDALVPGLTKHELDVEWQDGDDRHHQMICVDQSAIGVSPSSNPATYTKAFGPIRELFAATPLSRQKGFKPGRFSFHVAAGRCATCEGKGHIQIEMHFLADVWVTCETCRGKRYNQETLSVEYRGKNIAQVLEMDVDEALQFFGNHRKIVRPLQLLHDVGLGYLTLGQPANTFSGGEAQRIKLVAELARRPSSHTIYILDEPTTGLHADDVQKLLTVLGRLLDRGDSVLVIEHHLDVIAAADHVIEMGPEAGGGGGLVVAEGTPEQIARTKGSHTGRFLKQHLAALRKPPAKQLKQSTLGTTKKAKPRKTAKVSKARDHEVLG
jgi:excinuclease ABC subunit A